MTRKPCQRLSGAQNMLIDGLQAETFVITLGTSVSQFNVRNFTPGRLYVFVLRQDRRGGHQVNWGNAAINGMMANPLPNAVTVQCFIAMNPTQLFAVPAGTWSEV